MTSEERFTRIENAVLALTEIQARHESQFEKQNAGIRDLIVLNRTFLDSQNQALAQIEELRGLHKHTDETLSALVDTVKHISEAVTHIIDTVTQIDEKLNALIDTVKHNDEKLNALIDIVDRIIRNRNGNKDL